jgi:glycosyltransferase involved in cell wall biosynthesis
VKLVHVVPTYYPAVRYGGPIWSVHALCKALAQRGHDVQVLTTNVDGAGVLDMPTGVPVDVDGVKVSYFPSRFAQRLYWSPAMTAQLPVVLREADFLHLHSIFLAPTSSAARVAESLGIPWCVSPRGALVPELISRRSTLAKRIWMLINERRTLERASFIHATSTLEAEDARRIGYRLPSIRVIPNGVEMPGGNELAFGSAVDRAGSGPYLLFLGRINWKKGLDRLIPAMAHVPGFRLVVAGNDEEQLSPRLKRLAQQSGVLERIDFVGAVAGEEKQKLLRGSTLLVLPSYSENFGNVLLESLAAGRPVAMTAEVGLAPAIKAAGAGEIISGVPLEMGKQLSVLIADRRNLDAMGERGYQLVQSQYTWTSVARAMEQAYLEAISARRMASS